MKNYFVTFAAVKIKRTRTGKIVKSRSVCQSTIECDKIKTYSDIENIQNEIKKKENYSDVAILGIVKIKKDKIDTLELMTNIYEEELKKHMGDNKDEK